VTLTACEIDTAPPPPPVIEVADLDEPEKCAGCGTTTDEAVACLDCEAVWCPRCTGQHFDTCQAEREYAFSGGWDE
jgi:hypothetical protein